MRKVLLSILFFASLSIFVSCEDNESKNVGIAPVSNITFEAGHGSILFKWDNPDVRNLAYIEISYLNEQKEIQRILTNGKLTEQLVVGIPSTESRDFKFTAYNVDGEASSSVEIMAAPLEPLLNVFNSKIRMSTDFGGINVSWNNTENEEFYVQVSYENINKQKEQYEVVVNKRGEGAEFVPIKGVWNYNTPVDLHVSTLDKYGNRSSERTIQYQLKERGKFSRDFWRTLYVSAEDDSYKATNLLDGNIASYWSTPEQNPVVLPQYATFDLARKVRIERAEFVHVPGNIQARVMVVYGSNVSGINGPWTEILRQDISGVMSQISQVFDLPSPAEYRYVKMEVNTKYYSDVYRVGLAEFALYGSDIVEN